MFNFQAQKKVSAATLTYEKTLELNDSESTFNSLINYKYYKRLYKLEGGNYEGISNFRHTWLRILRRKNKRNK